MLSNSTSIIVLFARTVVLSRLIPVETFGVYAWAASVVVLSSMIADIGIGSAFLHRTDETLDEDHAAAVHLTLKIIFAVLWALILGMSAFLADSQTRLALWVLTATTAAEQFAATPRVILVRRVVHRRLSLIDLLDNIISSVVAIVMAYQGYTLSALLSSHVISAGVKIVGLYVWKPVWKPHLAWDKTVMLYYLKFGRHIFASGLLDRALDRVDDLWVGSFLGKTPLGYYSRAYSLATYPRKVLAHPIDTVLGGTFAELKGDRPRLSKAFFRINALLIRSGFFIGGLLSLIAPEFISIVLTDKWMPILSTFRLMLVFTLFDPLKGAIASLLGVGVGKPQLAARARLIQLVVMVTGLFALGFRWNIEGVALAVNAMLVVGIILLFKEARAHVDFSLLRLFGVPGLALCLAGVIARFAIEIPGVLGNHWRTGLVKIVVFTTVYSITLLTLERHQIRGITRIFDAIRTQ